jgi:hypothetical protein
MYKNIYLLLDLYVGLLHTSADFRYRKKEIVMGTGRTFNKNPRTRPKKSSMERARRVKTQIKRLVALGLDEEVLVKMDPPDIRELLRCPAKLKDLV